MFVTIRAKLIGFSIISLLITALVGGLGYYSNAELADALTEAQGKLGAINVRMQGGIEHDAVRADVLQILRVAKSGDAVAYKEAANDLNEHLKSLSNGTAKIMGSVVLGEKTRQAVAVVRVDVTDYAKLAQGIAALAQTDILGAEAQFSVFNDAFQKLKADQMTVSNLIAGEMVASRKIADAAAQFSGNAPLAMLIVALILLSLLSYNIYRRIMSPLNQLRQAIGKIEGGHYDVRVNLHSQDEIGSLGRAFDKLIDDRISALLRRPRVKTSVSTTP